MGNHNSHSLSSIIGEIHDMKLHVTSVMYTMHDNDLNPSSMHDHIRQQGAAPFLQVLELATTVKFTCPTNGHINIA